MDRIRFLGYKGERILTVDYSNLKADEALYLMDEVKLLFQKEPPGSVLCLINVAKMRVNTALLSRFNAFMAAEGNTYMKAGAIVGLQGIQKIAYGVVMKFSNVVMPLFDHSDQALDWLVNKHF